MVVRIAAVAAVGVLGLLLAGCGGASAPAEGTALEPEAFPMEAAKLAEAPASAPEMDLAAAAGAEDGFLAERKEEAAGALADASSGNLALSPVAARAGDAPAAAPEATAAPAKPGAAPEAAAPGGVEAAARLATRDGHRTRAPQLLARLDSPDLEPLPAVSSDISVVIAGHRARVVLDLVFRNPSDRQLAGTLMVALPNGASPCYLGMFQGGGSRAPARRAGRGTGMPGAAGSTRGRRRPGPSWTARSGWRAAGRRPAGRWTGGSCGRPGW